MKPQPCPIDDVRSEAFAERFIGDRMRSHQDTISEATVLVMIVYSCVSFFVDFLMARPEYMLPLHVFRVITLGASALYYPIRRRSGPASRAWIAVLHLMFNTAFAWTLYDTLGGHQIERSAIPAAIVVTQAVFLTAGSPFRTRATLLLSFVQFLQICAACAGDFGAQYRFLIITFLVLACANVYHRTLINWTMLAARFELEGRLKVAPHDLVRRSIGNEALLADALKPQRRWCVCLASDWRGYQSLSRERTPEDLAAALEGYYDVCRSLLDRHFPAGNFYSDWIADELLIFFLAEDGVAPDALASRVLAFGRDLLLAKAAYSKTTGLPRAIDIGIASGHAIVGLSGPASNRKVMAVGEVPVRARKMQGIGKLLRQAFKEKDRIIYSRALFAETACPDEGRPVPPGEQVPAVLKDESLIFEDSLAADAAAA